MNLPRHRALRSTRAISAVALLAAFVAGCSSGGVSTTPVSTVAAGSGPNSATPVPSAPASGAAATPTTAPTATAAPTVAPTATAKPTAAPTVAAAASCTGQATTATSATASQTLSTSGGSICIPAFGGFGGTIAYPSVSSPITVTLTSSTTNANSYPALGTATPIFYLAIGLSGGTNFGSGAAGGGLTAASSLITVGTTYTVYGRATIAGFPVNFSPCQTVATAGASGGVITGLGTVLNNASVPIATTGILEIEPGASGSGPC